ncbi:SPFH domain-containing protein [Sphingobacterium sp. UT-1RO-CII-1]|uniref:SPFH domain-containing protein n=1 Tax=Sphingobacterium sp. UT-1RO-CII-1 TaxID=2995225 RepID=UPI00227B6F4B|nr:SPFH domain-containing protein [Sphingobacterium sp. UT-1RO-CII-1]MCY4779320.1 SPFH domain-containing protein [Sphingobacterium sp. UT-1RO-CII-1]
MEKTVKPISGYTALGVAIISLLLSIYLFITGIKNEVAFLIVISVILFIAFVFISKGIMIIHPNHSRVLNFFGKYVGTVKENGLFFINPLYSTIKLSLRSENLQGQTIKVNDKLGNPIEIGAVVVWKIGNTYKAVYDVERVVDYVRVQSEAAVRHLAVSFAYDDFEEGTQEITLRNGGEEVNHILENELTARLEKAGIVVEEARISHLAYAPEIASAMLQRQQATAIVAARSKIVEGAVGMVEMALKKLATEGVVELDEERKAVMVSNLMVVLCGDKAAQPVVNTGTLYN